MGRRQIKKDVPDTLNQPKNSAPEKRRATISPSSLRHPNQRAGLLIGLICTAFGVALAKGTDSLIPSRGMAPSLRDAMQGETLSSEAARNQRPIIEVDSGLRVVMIPEGRAFTYVVNYPDATSCDILSPVHSGVSNPSRHQIRPDDPEMYPQRGRPVIYRVACITPTGPVGDTLIVALEPRN